MNEIAKCGRCGKHIAPFEMIVVAGEGKRCYACFNHEMSKRLGVAFDQTALQPVVVADAQLNWSNAAREKLGLPKPPRTILDSVSFGATTCDGYGGLPRP